jgi:hypothetical protein
MTEPPNIQRWIGLDIHKAYFVAVGVDAEKQTVFGPQKTPTTSLKAGAPSISNLAMPS